jgi:hypothetical protein
MDGIGDAGLEGVHRPKIWARLHRQVKFKGWRTINTEGRMKGMEANYEEDNAADKALH